MPVTTAIRKKGTKTCAKCGGNVAASASECQNCGSSSLKKSIIIVRKVDATGEDANSSDAALEGAITDGESTSEDEELEDIDESEFEPAEGEDDEEEDGDEEEDDSEDEDAEEDDEEEEEDPKVKKRIVRRRRVAKSAGVESVNLDILLAALTVADDISKAVADGDVEEGGSYDTAMNTFNNVCDAGAPTWANGESISKEDDSAKLKRLKARVAEIRAQLKNAGVDDDEDDEDDDVEKSDSEDIFKGLNPKAAAILRNAQEIQERDKAREFEGIAKSFGPLPTSETDLGSALRLLSDTDKTAYETVTKALKAAAEAQAQSDIFKSFGTAQAGLAASGGDELDTIAKSIRATNTSLTEEQAYAQALHSNPQLYDEYIAKTASR